MYQLFAYGKKYNVKMVALIYPEHSGFDKLMTFKFDEGLSLLVIPFELSTGCQQRPKTDPLHQLKSDPLYFISLG
ncbi:hypothetical protein SPONL_362 [uncultured Candidatus Thioglobus sp.]|nr:hypothetical protein SPONL_362 [uncultured Candidatus Thioglobus sp.]